MNKTTTIRIDREVKTMLEKQKIIPDESFNSLITRLIQNNIKE